MKKIISFVIIFCFTECYAQTIISPQFSELKGIEDQSGNTHLFYRIYTHYEYDPIYQWSNHIYHWDKFVGVDTLFITASGIESPGYNFHKWVRDVDYWNNNPAEFIYCGGTTSGPFLEGSAYVSRFDGFINRFGYFWGSANYVDISPTDDSLLYLGINTDGGFGVLKSVDGGRSWDSVSVIYQFLSLNPYSENIYFTEDEERKLFRTTDSGVTFNLVDPEFLVDTRFYYDSDSLHIYRKAYNKLLVSDNLGEQFSWQTVFTKSTTDPFYFSNDISVSGSIYIADRKNIFLSTNYGNNFNLYKSLDKNIVGIYKKPNSNKLYAATKYKIYEITPDTIQLIKSLPIPDEVLSYYPLAIGNKWIYDENTLIHDPYPSGSHRIVVKEVIGDTIPPNGKHYFQIIDETLWESYVLERVDSSEGKVYRYYEDSTLTENEYLVDDLLAEVGDTVYSSRMGYSGGMAITTILAEETFEKWELNKSKKVFQQYYSIHPPVYSLTQDIGLDSIHFYFDYFGDTWTVLKGCIIDGIVYGDTTVVSVEDVTEIFPTKFSLSQNYPNPFNPTTMIRFTLPERAIVKLEVYDILGQRVAKLINTELHAGKHEIVFDGRNLASGMYIYLLNVKDKFFEAKKMILLK